ncbi:potassium channel family protein [Georgenia muralis]|uniref:Ion channel n=1 Tax=Georgenia muralis TaxID=154117 RepID=A0A3N4Z7K0_9MICO|nr:potassium channel family protein [Georgenia muralis]RPF28283.1 ion channel [Georgenia muralis]
MNVLTQILGGALVATALWDLFHTLAHPSGQGAVSSRVLALVWRLSKRLGRSARRLAGPAGVVMVIGTWGLLVIVGAALVYLPHLPESFSYATGLDPLSRNMLVDALYLSLVTVATLGFGDIVPTAPWLRLLIPLQALIGFTLLTGAVTWVLQIYPALSRRRVLSLRLATLAKTRTAERLDQLSESTAARVLENLAAGLTEVRVDLTQYTETYYFREVTPEGALARTIGYAAELAEAGQRSSQEDVRMAADVLQHTLEGLAQVLDAQFLHTGRETTDILNAYAADHGDTPRGRA